MILLLTSIYKYGNNTDNSKQNASNHQKNYLPCCNWTWCIDCRRENKVIISPWVATNWSFTCDNIMRGIWTVVVDHAEGLVGLATFECIGLSVCIIMNISSWGSKSSHHFPSWQISLIAKHSEESNLDNGSLILSYHFMYIYIYIYVQLLSGFIKECNEVSIASARNSYYGQRS